MANPWVSFLSLLPKNKRWIGKIKSINSITATATIEIPIGMGGASGSDIMLPTNNSYSVGEYVFIEGNSIVGKAPNLRTVSQEIIY